MKALRSTFSHELEFRKIKIRFSSLIRRKIIAQKVCEKRHVAAAGSKKFSKNPDKNQLWADSMTRFGT